VLSAHTFRGNSLALLDTFSSYQKMADSDNDVLPVKSVVTAKEFLDLGISNWYTKGRLRTLRTTKSKINRFKHYYGVRPSLCASIWEDLQRTTVAAARVDDAHLNPKHFLMALHTLKRYPTDDERIGTSITGYSKSD
jgi:hypothetical protein